MLDITEVLNAEVPFSTINLGCPMLSLECEGGYHTFYTLGSGLFQHKLVVANSNGVNTPSALLGLTEALHKGLTALDDEYQNSKVNPYTINTFPIRQTRLIKEWVQASIAILYKQPCAPSVRFTFIYCDSQMVLPAALQYVGNVWEYEEAKNLLVQTRDILKHGDVTN